MDERKNEQVARLHIVLPRGRRRVVRVPRGPAVRRGPQDEFLCLRSALPNRPYQTAAARVARAEPVDRSRLGRLGLIWHMGQGKTHGAILASDCAQERSRRDENRNRLIIVISPLALVEPFRVALRQKGHSDEEIATNYRFFPHSDLKKRFDEVVAFGTDAIVVVDEVHLARNPDTTLGQIVRLLGDRAWFLTWMTGTPIVNRLIELVFLARLTAGSEAIRDRLDVEFPPDQLSRPPYTTALTFSTPQWEALTVAFQGRLHYMDPMAERPDFPALLRVHVLFVMRDRLLTEYLRVEADTLPASKLEAMSSSEPSSPISAHGVPMDWREHSRRLLSMTFSANEDKKPFHHDRRMFASHYAERHPTEGNPKLNFILERAVQNERECRTMTVFTQYDEEGLELLTKRLAEIGNEEKEVPTTPVLDDVNVPRTRRGRFAPAVPQPSRHVPRVTARSSTRRTGTRRAGEEQTNRRSLSVPFQSRSFLQRQVSPPHALAHDVPDGGARQGLRRGGVIVSARALPTMWSDETLTRILNATDPALVTRHWTTTDWTMRRQRLRSQLQQEVARQRPRLTAWMEREAASRRGERSACSSSTPHLAHHINYASFTGRESAKQREAARHQLNARQLDVLIFTPAGAVGQNFWGVSEQINIDQGWSPTEEEQASARIIRSNAMNRDVHPEIPPQVAAENMVTVYNLLLIKPSEIDWVYGMLTRDAADGLSIAPNLILVIDPGATKGVRDGLETEPSIDVHMYELQRPKAKLATIVKPWFQQWSI